MTHARPITDVQYVEREGVELVELQFNDAMQESASTSELELGVTAGLGLGCGVRVRVRVWG